MTDEYGFEVWEPDEEDVPMWHEFQKAAAKEEPAANDVPATGTTAVTTQRKVRTKRNVAKPVTVYYDSGRPHLEPFAHQVEAFEKFNRQDDIALFFEMGCGKSFTTLYIAQEKFKRGEIKGLLVIAPNDVHKQWYDELVNGVDKDRDGVMWQELTIDFEAQCVGGRGGQKELYEFEFDSSFKFVSVNVDTFSQQIGRAHV